MQFSRHASALALALPLCLAPSSFGDSGEPENTPSAEESIFTWDDAIGTHYRPDPTYRRAGAIRGYPHGGLGLKIFTDAETGTPVHGPFSGTERRADYAAIDEALSELETDAPQVDLLVWSMSPDKQPPEQLTATIHTYQDAVYAHALYLAKHPHPEIYLQAGNEVNGFFFNPTDIHPASRQEFYAEHYNSAAQAGRYVQWGFAPFVEAERLAAEDTGHAPEEFTVILGSVTAATNPDSLAFLDLVLATRIDSEFAPTLAGETVSDLTDIIAVHYMMNRGPQGLSWQEGLDHLYHRWLETGAVEGIWLTEEGGTANQGAADAAVVLARFFSWWADKAWTPRRGRLFFWSDWAASRGIPIAYMERYWGDFFGPAPFYDASAALHFDGNEKLEGHAFVTTPGATSARSLAVLFADDYGPGSTEVPADVTVHTVEQPLPPRSGDALRTAAYLFDVTAGFRRLDDVTATRQDDTVRWQLDQALAGADRAVLLLFADASPQLPGGPAFDGPVSSAMWSVSPQPDTLLLDLEYSSGLSPLVKGGLDAGAPGDEAALVANRRNSFSPTATVQLGPELEQASRVRVRLGLQGGISRLPRYGEENGATASGPWIAVYWDDQLLLRLDGDACRRLGTHEAILDAPSPLMRSGEHRLRLACSPDFFACQLDAVEFTRIDSDETPATPAP
jgi:hypothetical protein